MRFLMYVVIAAAMLAAYVSSPEVRLAPSALKFLPDVATIAVGAYVVASGVRQQFYLVDSKYWFVFGALALVIVCGPLMNNEAVGPILNGMRYYLRAIPLFFLPAVFTFRDRDLRNYMIAFLMLSLLQTPLAVYQRMYYISQGHFTGDYVFGTLMISGILSIFLIAILCVMTGLMLRGRFNKILYLLCFAWLVVPMSVNETKVTIFLLPLGLLVTFWVASPRGRRTLVMFQAVAVLIVAGLIFVPLYDHYNKRPDGTQYFTIEDFLTKPGTISDYLDRKSGVGTGQEAGRTDSLRAPFTELSHDPLKLFFGLGIGNASKSSLGNQFSGQYKPLYWNYVLELSITAFLFEIGLIGTALVLVLHWFVLRDALYVSRNDKSLQGDLAPGYAGAWVVITLGLFYLAIHAFESISYMFWFFSGVFAARRMQLQVIRKKAQGVRRATMLAPTK